MQELGLVLCRASDAGLIAGEIFPNGIEIEGHQFLPFLSVMFRKEHPQTGREFGFLM